MRVARNDASLVSSFGAAKQEAESAFGDGSLYLEKYIEHMRHIEVQILADEHGNIVHLGERDCTVQRRQQKLIEESPSPVLDKRTRFDIQMAAVKLMKTAGYTNAGTVEFIYDLDFKKFYFMEVNARLQVEHPVTEMVTGLDLVEEQLRVASGEPLRHKQRNIVFRGHAVECRLNAEDPRRGFAPAPGRINMYCPPIGRGIRMDTHVYSGYVVPPYYDSMLAKLIVHDRTREEALKRMTRALGELVLEGLPTTVPFLKDVCGQAKFVAADYDTSFVTSVMGL
jgi:acetyl-CoA carboxylase biotin carboxylase subunit